MSTHTIKGLREEFKAAGKFHTPPELAIFLRSLIPGDPARVYDPTCGAGSLLAAFPAMTEKFGQDIDAAAIQDAATQLENFHGHTGDVFEDPAWLDERFEAIVANPPFSINWVPQADERFMFAPTVPTASRADYGFLLHILHMLSPTGVAAVLSFPGVLYRGGREGTLRAWFVENNYVDQVIQIPGSTFVDTTISTACMVLRKNRTEDTIKFVDRENGIERDVPISVVAANGYLLSVTAYVQPPEEEREQVDPVALERLAWAGMVRKLRAELEMSRFISEMEGTDFIGLLGEVRDVLRDFEPTSIHIRQGDSDE